MEKSQLRAVLLFEFQKGSTAKEAWETLQEALGTDVVSRATCYRWFKRFREEDINLSDRARSGRPSKIDRDQLHDLVAEKSTKTCRELAEELQVSPGTVHTALKSEKYTSKLQEWVPHNLTKSNMAARVEACTQLLADQDKTPFLDRLITSDEKWIYYENSSRKRYWSTPGSRPQTTPKRNSQRSKVMLCCWWDCGGIIHHEFLPAGKTVTSEIYSDQLRRVHQKLQEKRPAVVNRRGVVYHHDNARPHVSKHTLGVIAELGWTTIPHPPYSPDIAPSDYHLFRSLQHFLRDEKFASLEAIEMGVSNFITSKDPSFFRKGIEDLPRRWKGVLENHGDYFLE